MKTIQEYDDERRAYISEAKKEGREVRISEYAIHTTPRSIREPEGIFHSAKEADELCKPVEGWKEVRVLFRNQVDEITPNNHDKELFYFQIIARNWE